MTPSPAREAVYAALRAQPILTIRAISKLRARFYDLNPKLLDALADDLSGLPPHHLVAALRYLARNPTQYRWAGWGGEVPAINLKGAMWYARYSRAKAHKLAKRAA